MKMFLIIYFVLFMLFKDTSSVIYNLNDTEYARMPPLFALDDYDTCLNENNGIYCVSKLDLIADPDNDLMTIIKEYSKASLRHYNHSYIERGVCVRKKCSEFIKKYNIPIEGDLPYVIGECLNETIFRNYGLQSKLSKLYYCDSKETKIEIDLLDWCVAGVFFTIILINLIGSLYDYVLNNSREEKDRGNKYLLSFSVIRNWDWLVTSEFQDPKLRRLKGFYGARTITNLLMVYGHTISLIGAGYTDRPHSLEKTYNSALYLLLYNGTMIVQIFFFMSGFLLTYNFLIRTESFKSRITWTAVPVGVFLRWWRLTPALAVVIAFSMTWLRHLGSGPLWNLYVTNSVVSDCRKYWWSHLFYFNNYMPDNKYCAIQTWHIASDSQLFLVGLVVLVSTGSRGRAVVLALLLILSLVLPAFHVWLHNLDAIAFITPEFLRAFNNDTFYYLHIYGHINLSNYTVGMITAIFVHNWQNKGVDISKNKIYITILWLLVPGMIGVIYSASLFYTDGERASLVVRMVYAAGHRLVLSLIIAIGIIGIVMKCQIILRKIIEWRGWVVPGRLTYSVYLLHFNFIYILLGVRHNLIPMSFSYLYIYYFGIATMTYLLSVPFFLMVEAPLNRLMKNITSKYYESFKNNDKV